MQAISKVIELGDGRTITIETGKLARQADGAAVVRMGNTMLLATVVAKQEAAENVDFMPLSVDYQEKYAAVGRFPGGFFKREARPSEYEILISRLVDRALRPLFPDDFHAEVQVIITLISGDRNTAPDSLAALAASAALAVSDIPFNGPISEVRVARINGEYVVNPPINDIPTADLDLMIAASIDNIMMVEGELKEVSEDAMIEALKVGHEAIKIQCKAQLELAEMVGSTVKRVYCHETNDLEFKEKMKAAVYADLYEIAKKGIANKKVRKESFEKVLETFIEPMSDEEKKEKAFLIKHYFHDIHKEAVRDVIVNERTRLDGRKLNEIRPIW